MNCIKIVFLLVLSILFVACDEQETLETLAITGKIIELSGNVFGIDGESKVAGELISTPKSVKYKISWLPQAVKEQVRRDPATVYKYFYRILENGNDQDWSTTIEIITD